MTMNPTCPECRDGGPPIPGLLAKYYTRHMATTAQTENLPYADQVIDLEIPDVKDAYGLPAPRMTYDWRRPNEVARVEFMAKKMEEIGRAMGATNVWRANPVPGFPTSHHQGGTRMEADPSNSVVNRYGQSWEIPNLFIIGSSTFPTSAGFNPTPTIQALAYMTADAIASRYRKNPGLPP